MEPFNIIVAAVGGLVLAVGLGSKWLERTPVTPSQIALALGVVLSPAVLGAVDLADLGDRATVLERVTRLVLGVGLVGVALRVPKVYPRRHWREMAVLVGLGMPLMWAIGTALVYLVLGLPFWLAALIGAIVAATDPIAASPIVTGPVAKENLPERIRHAISFESGANDGFAYVFVFLALLMLTRSPEEALSHWAVHTVLWEVGAATALGLALGYAAGHLLEAAERRDLIEPDWRLVYTVAVSLLAVGVGRLIGSDEVLVAFAAGATFVQVVTEDDRAGEEHGQEAVNRFFSVPIFGLLGLAIPWAGWAALGWGGVLLAVAVVVLRRLPVLLLLRPLLPSLRHTPDALFVGWFGPVAVAAIYYAGVAEHHLGDPRVWDVVSLMVCVSVVLHGATATPLTRLYGRVTGARREIAMDREAEAATRAASD